jgi:hypothetical protein
MILNLNDTLNQNILFKLFLNSIILQYYHLMQMPNIYHRMKNTMNLSNLNVTLKMLGSLNFL